MKLKGKDIPFEIVLYDKKYFDKITAFDCGNEIINDYLIHQASTDIDVVTYLVINTDNNNIIGFVSLCCSGIRYVADDSFQATLPSIEIKYFAILNSLHKLVYDNTDKHFYFSDMVLCEILKKCRSIRETTIGARYIILYSVDDAVRFYKRNMFEPYTEFMAQDKIRFLADCTPMFMAL